MAKKENLTDVTNHKAVNTVPVTDQSDLVVEDADFAQIDHSQTLRITTFNCNSVRSRLDTILAWLKTYQPDFLALQETKAQDVDFPLQSFTDQGWQVIFRGEKSYNGVAIITKHKIDAHGFGLGGDNGASETRLVWCKSQGLNIVNTYVPQGRELDNPNFLFKLEWFKRLREQLVCHYNLATDQVIWLGDLNVAPESIDVYDSKKVWPHVCHCQEVIDAFKSVRDPEFTDVVRQLIPDEQIFTFWDYRSRSALAKNIGWRIDHILATKPLAERAKRVYIDKSVRASTAAKPSDHTFLSVDFAK